METLLAKFKVGFITDFGNNNLKASLSAVINDCPENKLSSIYTPSAFVEIHITNPEALDFFKAGSEYTCEFKKVEKATE